MLAVLRWFKSVGGAGGAISGLGEGFAGEDFGGVALPAIDERGAGAVELFEEGGRGAFRDLEFGEAGGVAVEEAGVGFEELGAADDAREIGGGGIGGGGLGVRAVEGDEGVREAAEIDAGALAEFDPVGIGEDFGGRRSEEVAPVAGVAVEEHRAGELVRARGDEAKGRAKGVAELTELAADGVRAGFDPEDFDGAIDERAEGGEVGGGELVEDVADDEEAERVGGGEKTGRGGSDLEAGEVAGGAIGGEVAGGGGVVPDGECIEILGTEELEDAAGGDAAAAAPVEDGTGGGFPVAKAELAKDVVPFPADALAVGEIVGREVGGGLPVGAAGGGAGEEGGAEAVEGGPIEVGPGHGREGRRAGEGRRSAGEDA